MSDPSFAICAGGRIEVCCQGSMRFTRRAGENLPCWIRIRDIEVKKWQQKPDHIWYFLLP